MRTNALRRLAAIAIAAAGPLLVLSAVVAIPTPAAAAGARPFFQLPVACGERWTLSTYVGHDDYDIDMTPNSGSAWGRPIYSSEAGTVVAAGIDGTLGDRTPSNPDGPIGTGGGYFVKLDHGGGWQTLYLHMLEPPMVSYGQFVPRGHQLGKVGSTGRSSGPHLHYEQLADGQKIESYFNGVASGITHDNAPYSVERDSYNCGGRAHGVSVSGGKVFHTLRSPDGSWTPWASLNNAGTATSVTAAADASGNVHVAAVIDGTLYHRVRYTNGNWTAFASLGPASRVAAAMDRKAHVLHLAAVINGTIQHRLRYANGSWSAWGNLGNGNQVAIAVDHAHNVLQMTAVVGGRHHHRVRNADGTWTPLVAIDSTGATTATAIATDHAGNAQVFQATAGTLYHRIRRSDGTWTNWLPLGDEDASTITAAVNLTQNNLQAMTIFNGTVHHRVRNSNGTWTPWMPYSPSNVTTQTAITVT